MNLQGGCHCGNLRLELEWPETDEAMPARACDCSFCTRHGGVWTSHPGAVLDVVVAAPDDVSRYAFGTRTATFHVCRRCGVVPVVTSRIEERLYAVVNVHALDVPASAWRTAPASFGSEDVATRLARRQRNWIANVRVRTGPPDAVPAQ